MRKMISFRRLTSKRKLALIPLVILLTLTISYELVYLRENTPTWVHHGNETRHMAFLKVHKTGSTTAQNIFLRFADSRNLVFILGRVINNDCGGAEHCISERNSLSDTNIVPPPVNKRFETLCCHVVYNKQQFRKYLPNDTKYISLVRDPVKRLQSAISHFSLLDNRNLSDFADDPYRYDHFRLNNGMSFEFGFPSQLFPNKVSKSLDLKGKITALTYVQELFKDFSLIMVNERLDESLILLRRILNWQTKDILYLKQRVRKEKYRTFSAKEAEKLKPYLMLDYLLYDTAVMALDELIATAGDSFYTEVTDFKQVNNKVVRYCAQFSSYHPTGPLVIAMNRWHSKITITNRDCATMKRQEEHYLDIIRVKQYGTMNTE